MTRHPILPGGDIFLEKAEKLSARRALLRLLARRPNELVTHADVEEEAGRTFTDQNLSNAANRLGRDMAIRSKTGTGGGYVLLVPTEAALYEVAPNRMEMRTCAECAHHTALGHCRELDRDVETWQWCAGWRDGA